ncbi:MAG: transposase [bacterium]|nr:transposase [bacterium]
MKRSPRPKRKSPRLEGSDYAEPRCYFVTICTFRRRPAFAESRMNRAVLSQLREDSDGHDIALHAWCLMPDHLHLLVELPGEGLSLPAWVGPFKSRTTLLAWAIGFQGRLWQRWFFDRILRREESIERVAEYIIHNPVRKGFVETWVEYPWSGLGPET